jgi:hypothetical protein
MSIEIKGMDEFIAKLKTMMAEAPTRMDAAIYEAAQPVFQDSQLHCPVLSVEKSKEGRKAHKRGLKHGRSRKSPYPISMLLKNSGKVERLPGVVTISYGGAASAYAHRQHEELGWEHKAPQTSKWLENAVNKVAPAWSLLVSERLKLW